MPPLSLTTEMISTLTMLAQPIRREQRDAFLQQVAQRLKREKVIGEGSVARIAREIQREYLLGLGPQP